MMVAKPCPGSKIRSKGKGRGLGVGQGKGPVGLPLGQKLESFLKKKKKVAARPGG
jgi:hypothetical protein